MTLGSQEGAFENVRMNFSGDQGQQIRQLINNHVLRRVAMCVLASPHGKRQHLAVSHEKGKITILQLSALLKQADSSKKKLTLTVRQDSNILSVMINVVQWWFVNPGSDSPEISLVRTKSVGTNFHILTNGRFSNLENSFIRKYRPGTNVSG